MRFPWRWNFPRFGISLALKLHVLWNVFGCVHLTVLLESLQVRHIRADCRYCQDEPDDAAEETHELSYEGFRHLIFIFTHLDFFVRDRRELRDIVSLVHDTRVIWQVLFVMYAYALELAKLCFESSILARQACQHSVALSN